MRGARLGWTVKLKKTGPSMVVVVVVVVVLVRAGSTLDTPLGSDGGKRILCGTWNDRVLLGKNTLAEGLRYL